MLLVQFNWYGEHRGDNDRVLTKRSEKKKSVHSQRSLGRFDFFLSCFRLILKLRACSCTLTKFLHKRQCWVPYTTLLLSRSSSYVNQSMGYWSDHKIWLHFYANLFTCISVPRLPSQNWVFPRESPVIITKLLIGKKEYYHSKQIFLSFHWPRAHYVTCK